MSDTILHTIVRDAAAPLKKKIRDVPVSSLLSMEGFSRPCHSLADALEGSPVSIIAEIKRRSPSKGLLRDSFNVRLIAESYERAGAAALSVLTEENYFAGHIDHLRHVRAVCSLPILRKDFIVDPYQLFEARAYGADAALLIATLLDKSQISELLHAADEAGISCLVELYHAAELDKLDFDQISILGANNRDLRTFDVDTSRAPEILGAAPPGVVLVAESGLSTATELVDLTRLHIDAALIGETFMVASDPGDALANLLGTMHDQLESVDRNKAQ